VQRRVVVTGLGLVTPLAIGTEETWQKILAGESGIRTIQKFDASEYKTQIAGEVLDFNAEDWLPKKKVKRLDVFIHFGLAATRMAWEMAGLPTPLDDQVGPRTGCIMGVGLGGLQSLEETIPKVAEAGAKSRVSPFFIPKLIGNMLPGEVSMEFGAKGPNTCLATACAAGTHAVGDAMKVIQLGAADIMACGGAEAVVTPTTLQGFGSAKALSTRNDDPARASRPFDADRDGFIMSEGSGVLILEALETALERGANIIAELVGYGLSSDGYHMTAPDPTGAGYIRCMQMAMDDAQFKPEDIDYINAHGTSTGLNDLTETQAIKAVFGDHAKKLAVSSTKSMIGHMLGATGGVEAVMSVLTLRDQVMPPTINYNTPDPECDLDYVPNTKREGKVRAVLSNSFGFGGTNASVIFTQYKP
jgi:3-oxoacyl-[acyl-carrier-protein] synthase II